MKKPGETPVSNLVLGCLCMLGLSNHMPWSVIQPYAMTRFGLEATAASIPYYMFMIFFTIGSICSGMLQKRWPLKRVLVCGCACVVGGFLAVSLLPSNLFALCCLFYGMIAGLGNGISYNVVLVTVQRWYAKNIGRATGIILCLVGIASFLATSIANYALDRIGFSGAFRTLALYYTIIFLPAILFLKSPPETAHTQSVAGSSGDYTPRQVLRSPQYYLIVCAFMFAVPAFTLINPVFVLVSSSRNLSPSLAVAGAAAASITQTVGRYVFPALSDRIRTNNLLLLEFAISAAAVILAAFSGGWLFLICYLTVSFTQGGFMGTFPAISTKHFGLRHSGTNYGLVMIGNSLAGILCPLVTRFFSGANARFAAGAIFSVLGMLSILLLNVVSGKEDR